MFKNEPNKSLDKHFKNLRDLSKGEHSLEEVFEKAGVEICPECKTPFRKEIEERQGKYSEVVRYCEGCGNTYIEK